MNASVVLLAVEDGGVPALAVPALSIRQVLGFALYDLAMHGGIALSDRYGCWTTMAQRWPSPVSRRDLEGGHRIAVDLAQGHARRLDTACRAALARAETVAERATGIEAHAALAEIGNLITSALVGLPS